MERIAVLSPLNGLIVAANAPLRGLLRSVLAGFGMSRLQDAASSDEALALIRTRKPDFLICSHGLTPLDGIAFARYLRHEDDSPNPYIPLILVMDAPDPRRLAEARDAGVTAVVAVPVRTQSLRNHLIEMVERPRPYIRVGSYFGPDRRVGMPFAGANNAGRRVCDNHP